MLGVRLTVEGLLPQAENQKRAAAWGVAQRCFQCTRGLLAPDAQAKRAAARLLPSLSWAWSLLVPSLSSVRRWQGLQSRLFAMAWRLVPEADESSVAFWRRRCRHAAQQLVRLGIPSWGAQHLRFYYRAAARVARSDANSLARLAFAWKSRCEQRTVSFLSQGRSTGRRPGNPARWDDLIGRWLERQGQMDWLLAGDAFSPVDEEAFVQWASASEEHAE